MQQKLQIDKILANYENQQFPDSKEANLMEMISLKDANKAD